MFNTVRFNPLYTRKIQQGGVYISVIFLKNMVFDPNKKAEKC